MFFPPLAMYFLENFKEFSSCHLHFHNGQEYIWIPLLPMIKSYDTYSFEMFMTMLKVYLSLRGEAVAIELDLHEVTHEIDIIQGQIVVTIRDVSAPQEVIELFCRVFVGITLHSLYLHKYVYLKIRAMLKERRSQMERELAIRRRLLEAYEAALDVQANEAGGP